MVQGVTKMRFQTKACIAGLKSILMLFNLFFWFTGFIMIIIGLWMKFSLGKYLAIDVKYAQLSLPAAFIVVGLGVFALSIFACTCTSKGQPKLLIGYAVILGLSFIITFSFGIAGYVYRNDLRSSFHDAFESGFKNYGEKRIITHDMDRLQEALGCCGINNYTDYFATAWANGTSSVPGSCCISKEANCRPKEFITDENLNTIFNNGCFDELMGYLNAKFSTIGGLALTCAFTQLIGAFVSGLLAKYINKAVYETLE